MNNHSKVLLIIGIAASIMTAVSLVFTILVAVKDSFSAKSIVSDILSIICSAFIWIQYYYSKKHSDSN